MYILMFIWLSDIFSILNEIDKSTLEIGLLICYLIASSIILLHKTKM